MLEEGAKRQKIQDAVAIANGQFVAARASAHWTRHWRGLPGDPTASTRA
jgi:hypothetical protein